MEPRTDLALELREQHPECKGVVCSEKTCGDVTVTSMTVETEQAERELGRPRGRYVTVALPSLSDHAFIPEERYEYISAPLAEMLPREGTVLVAGLGNEDITPDALGPRAVSMIPATRHIMGELERSMGRGGMRSCAVMAPGVLGQTGVEAVEMIRSVCRAVKPAAVIVIDALASRSLDRLGSTVQLCDTGIHPGSGVGNSRPAISAGELGVPVIAAGIPTVVDGATLARDLCAVTPPPRSRSMIVTPREVDLLVRRSAQLLALAVNHALHPAFDPAELTSL